jgi:deoxyribodipyrimidine photo-lyase
MKGVSLFLFHRDFRVIDNKSLNALHELSSTIVPIFIFTPDQVDPKKNPYYNEKSIRFMKDCLADIPHLQIFYGETEKVLSSLFRNNNIENIGFNLDYTPYALKRTQKIEELCKKYNVNVIAKEDYTLLDINDYRDGGFYKVFKPFFEKVMSKKIDRPTTQEIEFSIKKLSIASTFKVDFVLKNKNKNKDSNTHREEALSILKNKTLAKNYENDRNLPSIETTHLSKHIKFGTVSIREVFHAYKKYTELVRQVVWHDFYACLMKFLPLKDTIGGGNVKHLDLEWSHNKTLFTKWCKGETGFPIIDAGMRQLNETGWMHNRVRLLVSNFLAVLVGIDWRWGERYFAQKLVDYDISSNNLNWQFSAQVGTDRTAFLRVYNPFIQSEKYDPDCVYIKKWIHELRNVDNSVIHKWGEKYDKEQSDYPAPMIDYREYSKKAKKLYKKSR